MGDRDFKGVWIPKTIWLDERLNALDKVILTEIDSLDKGEDGCFASNDYIAKFCQCSPSKVSKSVSKLIEYGYIYVKKFDGRIRYLKSRMTNYDNQPSKIYEADYENMLETNTKNNINNNIYSENKKNKNKIVKKSYGEYGRVKLTDKEYEKLCEDFNKDFIDNQIKLLDEYVEGNNNKNKYSNFNLVLRRSIRENWFKTKEEKKPAKTERRVF